MQHVVAGLADRHVELVVGADGDELPAMRLVLWQAVVDHGRLRRAVEIVLDLVDLRHLRQFGDVERAVLEGDAVRPVHIGVERLDLAFAVLVGDGVDLADQARADEHRALVAEHERARVRHARGIDLDVEAGRHLQLGGRQLVGGGGERRRRDRREFLRSLIVRAADHRRAGRQRRCRRRRRCSRRRRLLGGRATGERTEKCAGKQQAARRQKCRHESPPLERRLSSSRRPIGPAGSALPRAVSDISPVARNRKHEAAGRIDTKHRAGIEATARGRPPT